MINLIFKTRRQTLTLMLLIMSLGACGAIPSAYRGQFQDQSQLANLELASTKGVFTTPEEILEASAQSLDFKDLLAGKPGIYVRPNPINKKLLDVFWIKPDMTTREEAGGMVWYSTDVYYTLFNSNIKDKVASIRLLYSGEGNVMLELQTKLWQVGWPAGPKEYLLKRVSK